MLFGGLLSVRLLLLVSGLGFASASPLSTVFARDVTTANAELAFDALQQWYNISIGLWIPSTGWWNSANCMLLNKIHENGFTDETQA